ncbi:MAG: alpha/beta hydrolase [Verrucomicrobiota bacterium]
MKKLFVVFLLVTAGWAFAEAPVFEFEGAEAETYKTASGDELKIYIFTPEDHDPETDERPAIVFFFGGGWSGGTPEQFEQHCRYLASRGMVAMTADYRVRKRQGTSPKECVADGKSAVRWVRENAKRLGVDAERVAAGGGSAGGHVATATGMVDGYEDEADDLSVSSKADALVLFNPVYDNGPEDGWGHARVEEYWERFSPAHNITKDDPPAVVFLGSKDDLIPVSTAERFRAKMEEVGLESELHVYEGEAHGFFNQKKGGEEVFKDTVRKMDEFLVGIGFLEGEGTEGQVEAVVGVGTFGG